MIKSFREVVRDIGEGEVWECEGFEIECMENGTIQIELMGTGRKFGFYKNDSFVQKRKEYDFCEAFEAYERGKEIQSAITNTCYVKESKRAMEGDKHFLLGMAEIRNKWYIND